MVLESLINPFKAEKKPWEMIFFGFLYNTVAIFLSLLIFKEYASLVMVFLTTIAAIPLMFAAIKKEERFDLRDHKEHILLKEHYKVLLFLVFMFLGVMLSVTFWYIVLPTSLHPDLFGVQSKTIQAINAPLTGYTAGEAESFFAIFLNNLRVLLFCLLFALFYCFGSIFILIWNASIIGVAIGNSVRTNLANFSSYFSIVPLAILRYMTHGIFEISAFFIAGLAGGIISIAFTRHDFGTKRFEHVLLDSVDLVLLSILLLFIAALIEVFITPRTFSALF